MRRFVSILLFVTLIFPVQAQKDSSKVKEEGFVFTTLKENPITSIKNQNRSGTCWAYSGLGFLESELLRLGKGTHDLSRMYIVRHTYMDRGTHYVRLHGDAPLGQGGSFYDVVYGIKNYGIVPESVYVGIEYGDSLPNFNELDKVMTAYIQAIGKAISVNSHPSGKRDMTECSMPISVLIPRNSRIKARNTLHKVMPLP